VEVNAQKLEDREILEDQKSIRRKKKILEEREAIRNKERKIKENTNNITKYFKNDETN
jgi:hypothetical protein